jgi:hypothetical protein
MLLIEYLEEASENLGKKRESFHKLSRQYKKFYSKDIREEMNILRKEINHAHHEINEKLYERLNELSLIKSYFPDLYNIFLEDEAIGKLMSKKNWLLDRKDVSVKKAQEDLSRIKSERAQLKEAKAFVKKWPRGHIDSKSIKATWPILKSELKGELDKEDLLDIIAKKDKELKKSGWLTLIDESMIEQPIARFANKIRVFSKEEQEKEKEAIQSKGKGSVKEYEASKELEAARSKRKKYERILRHLLLSNRKYLEMCKKKSQWGQDEVILKEIISKISLNKIDEKNWLKEMRKKLEA